MLKKIISGGQNGADCAGLRAAKACGIPTGGMMPKGWITQDGPKPEYESKYNLEQHSSPTYPPRTELNVKNSDGTIRFAKNFNSAGEKCTLKFINKHDKPYFDIDVTNLQPVDYVIDWIVANDIKVLNIAGNTEKTCPGIESVVFDYLVELFIKMKNTKINKKSKEKKCIVSILADKDFNDYNSLTTIVKNSKLEINELVCGYKTNIDGLIERFAVEHKIQLRRFNIEWDNLDAPGAVIKTGKYGPYNSRAAADRNRKVSEYCTHAIALQVSGYDVSDMIKRFEELGKKVIVHETNNEDVYEF